MLPRIQATLLTLTALAACSGGSSAPPTTPTGPGTETRTFTGTSEVTATGGCRNDGHTFETGEGSLTVTLTQSTPSVSLNLQVCHPTAVDHARECTVPPFARIDVGMTLSATLRGGRAQVLTLYPLGCGTPSPAPTPPITYTVAVVHPR